MVSMCSEKPINMHSTPSLRSFPNVAFGTVPMFVWLTMALSCPFKVHTQNTDFGGSCFTLSTLAPLHLQPKFAENHRQSCMYFQPCPVQTPHCHSHCPPPSLLPVPNLLCHRHPYHCLEKRSELRYQPYSPPQLSHLVFLHHYFTCNNVWSTVSYLVSWCFEPSQPCRVISGLISQQETCLVHTSQLATTLSV